MKTLDKLKHRIGPRTAKGQVSALFEQLKAIPWASFWSLSLTLGGLLLLSYFSSIEYLPDIDINTATVTIAGVAVVGAVFVLLIGVGLTLPTLYLDAVDDPDKKRRVLAQAAIGIGLAFGVVGAYAFGFREEPGAWGALISLAVMFSALSTGKSFSFANWASQTSWATGWCFWAIMVPMLYVNSFSRKEGTEWIDILLLFTVTCSFALISIGAAYAPLRKRAASWFVAAVTAVLLLSYATDRPALVPNAAVAVLGLSVERKSVTLILSESGCKAVNMVLSERPCSFDKEARLGSLSEVRVVSRIGGQFVIHLRPTNASAVSDGNTAIGDSNQRWRRTILRKEDVVSWAYEFGTDSKQRSQEPRP